MSKYSSELARLESAERAGFSRNKVKKQVKDPQALRDFIFGKSEVNPVTTIQQHHVVKNTQHLSHQDNKIFHTDYNGNKVCKECGESKNNNMFYSSPNTMDGLAPKCKSCANKIRLQYMKKEEQNYNESVQNNEDCICMVCKVAKPISAGFKKNVSYKGGFKKVCIECSK